MSTEIFSSGDNLAGEEQGHPCTSKQGCWGEQMDENQLQTAASMQHQGCLHHFCEGDGVKEAAVCEVPSGQLGPIQLF